MEALTVYFNELSIDGRTAGERSKEQWGEGAEHFASIVDSLLSARSDSKIAFPSVCFASDCGGQDIFSCLRAVMGRENYRRLLRRSKNVSGQLESLDFELQVRNIVGYGSTLAHLDSVAWGAGWTISLAHVGSAWYVDAYPASRINLNSEGEFERPVSCDVLNIASGDHFGKWLQQLLDWGAKIAASSYLDDVAGHPVVMYPGPKEHNPPHVHLLESRNSHQTIAKYRIDVFERHKGVPDWDAEMALWISKYREQLLRSWDRCQMGGHPYELDK